MKDLKVRGLNSRTLEFEEFALHSDFVVGALGLKHFLWIVGPAGCGKTTLACALAQYFTEGLDKSTFICTASYDALGMLTRNGKTMEQGSFVMDDAPFVSQNDIPLTDLNMISFCLPLQQCSIPARYHVAQCPAKVTRMGTHNAKMDPNTKNGTTASTSRSSQDLRPWRGPTPTTSVTVQTTVRWPLHGDACFCASRITPLSTFP